MYLHIGNMKSVRDRDVLGIFNLDGQRTTQITASFLKNAEKQKKVENVDLKEIPRSFILLSKTKKKNDYFVFLSPISASTLLSRFNSKNENL